MTQTYDAVERDFDLGDAAFHLFKYIGAGHLGGLLFLLVIYLIGWSVMMAVGAWLILPTLDQMPQWVTYEADNIEDVFDVVGPFLIFLSGMILFSWVFRAVMDAAMLRWYFGRNYFPRVGGGEIQLMLVSIFWLLLIALVWAPLPILLATGHYLDNPYIAAAGLAYIILGLWLNLYVAVKFAPAAAVTIHDKFFGFFRAFSVTGGKFWGLLGAFIVAIVVIYVMEFVMGTVVQIALFLQIGDDFFRLIMSASEYTDEEALEIFASMFSVELLPMWGVFLLFIFVLDFLRSAMFAGVNAYRVKQRMLEMAPPVADGPEDAPSARDSDPEMGEIATAVTAVAAASAISEETKSEDAVAEGSEDGAELAKVEDALDEEPEDVPGEAPDGDAPSNDDAEPDNTEASASNDDDSGNAEPVSDEETASAGDASQSDSADHEASADSSQADETASETNSDDEGDAGQEDSEEAADNPESEEDPGEAGKSDKETGKS